MNKYPILLLTVFALAFSNPGQANPGLFWELVKKATQGPAASKEWSQVEDWLTSDISENIDWNPAGEETTRVLMQRSNPELYNKLFGSDGEEPKQEIEIAPPARTFFGLYGGSQAVLGTGFSGAVEKHVHRLSGIPVAVKTLKKAQYEQCELLFPPIEAELMAKLWHPNIVRFYEAITTPDAQYLIMELVLGSDLFTWSQKQDLLSENACKLIMHQVVAALDCMHRAHICHRDLKSENILIDAQGSIKVIDLGLACFYDPHGQIEQYCGSPEYAAPEVLRETPYVGPEIDIWALAVILYDLAVGELPFQTAEDAIALNYVFPDDVALSPDFCDLIEAIFQNPAHRANLEQILKHAWFKDNNLY